jgi:hypothetical protein
MIQLEAIAAGPRGHHDRWLTTRTLLARKLGGRRSTCRRCSTTCWPGRLPSAKELGITPRAAQDLVAELGLREAMGRGRYRAWGVL